MKKAVLFIVTSIVLAGCSLFGNDKANQAVEYANRGVALLQCSQKAIKSADPEGGTLACTKQWLPELPPAASAVAADYARCARERAVAAKGLEGDAKLTALIQGA